MSPYQAKKDYPFQLSDYQNKPTFANLLPGIAGPLGIPLWIFYVNRGQGISSFGISDKDHPIMEFQPANKAFQTTPLTGFRTFVKKTGQAGLEKPVVVEPFGSSSKQACRTMWIGLNEFKIQDENPAGEIRMEVLYTNLTHEPVGGLIRKMELTNLGSQSASFEILDGLPVMIPFGLTNSALKETSRTMEAWYDIKNRENNLPFYQLRSTIKDSAEIHAIEGGNFSTAVVWQSGQILPVQTIVSPELVFGQDTSLQTAKGFETTSLDDMVRLQSQKYVAGKTPCSFFGFKTELGPGQTVTVISVYGHASNMTLLDTVSSKFASADYFFTKILEARQIVADLVHPVRTKTSSPEFDQYCNQTFLDNLLRGGWPIQLGSKENPVNYHIYSRKHGDPERDYNAFYLAPEFYSQGNGNYRDVNQNRRNDVWFEPKVMDGNIRAFMSLIQTDGYNPLIVKGSQFKLPREKLKTLLDQTVEPRMLVPFLRKPFTPGSLLTMIAEHKILLCIPAQDFLQLALGLSEQYFDAEFGEGYWTDHWTYNLDLIDSYLAIYPDKSDELFDKNAPIPYYESARHVQPRERKYVLVGDHPRQYHAVAKDPQKAALISNRSDNQHFMHDANGKGSVFKSTLRVKLVLLAVIKFATLDPYGMGVEMEADKPGWCDALNGLPGLFGSSFPDTLELYRLLNMLIETMPETLVLDIPVEMNRLMEKIHEALRAFQVNLSGNRDFIYWDAVSLARETYREETRFGIEGTCQAIQARELRNVLNLCRNKVKDGIERAIRHNHGIPPTYFTYVVDRFEIIHLENGKPLVDENNHPYIKVLGFSQKDLPLFLEGPARWMKQLKGQEARTIYAKIKGSDLFDRSLSMYKTNVSLAEQTYEIGRLRVFTPGWLENESIFLHMEYKYLLSVLKSGLYQEFFEDLRTALPAFLDPERYGRNPMENSSFIVSSAHPDPDLHGRGFVARLTGSTAEFLSMWNQMMFGPVPFHVREGELYLQFDPVLPAWLFDSQGEVACTFLGQCTVIYHNGNRKDTFDHQCQIIKQILSLDDETIELDTPAIPAPYAAWVREGRVRQIDVHFN